MHDLCAVSFTAGHLTHLTSDFVASVIDGTILLFIQVCTRHHLDYLRGEIERDTQRSLLASGDHSDALAGVDSGRPPALFHVPSRSGLSAMLMASSMLLSILSQVIACLTFFIVGCIAATSEFPVSLHI